MKNNILPLITEPNLALYKKSQKVNSIDNLTIRFCKDLVRTMQYHGSLGLAAVQVGLHKKIIAISATKDNSKVLKTNKVAKILINPEIIEVSQDKKSYNEGCLSFSNIFLKIERYNKIIIKYINLDAQEKILEISNNIISSCLQHEIDHTNGIVFLDRIAENKRIFFMKKYLKLREYFYNIR